MGIINDEIDNSLIRGLKRSKRATRNTEKIELLKTICLILEEYFKNDDVKVKLSFDKNFKDFASISIRGKDIEIDDKGILKLLDDHVSYANVFIEHGSPCLELTFSGLIKKKGV